jgi:tetrahydromethanopterin:alpha-L-glutamate ligase
LGGIAQMQRDLVAAFEVLDKPQAPHPRALPACGERQGPRVAVFTDKLDWHVIRTLRALRAQGATPVAVRLSACKIETGRAHGLVIPGFRDLPDLAIVRAIGDGSLEAITMRLGALHALEALGVSVVNSARAIERCTDKSMASFLLAQAGLPTPETFAAQSLAQARAIARRECAKGPLAMKPLFGAQGWGLRLIENESDLPSLQEARGVFYLQRFVGPARPPFEDMRILVSRGDIVAAMRRRSSHWITNVRQGAKPLAVEPSAREAQIALAAAKALGVDFAGVDLINDRKGEPLILEVNSMPGWSGLQRVTPFSIADRIVADALALMTPARPRV